MMVTVLLVSLATLLNLVTSDGQDSKATERTLSVQTDLELENTDALISNYNAYGKGLSYNNALSVSAPSLDLDQGKFEATTLPLLQNEDQQVTYGSLVVTVNSDTEEEGNNESSTHLITSDDTSEHLIILTENVQITEKINIQSTRPVPDNVSQFNYTQHDMNIPKIHTVHHSSDDLYLLQSNQDGVEEHHIDMNKTNNTHSMERKKFQYDILNSTEDHMDTGVNGNNTQATTENQETAIIKEEIMANASCPPLNVLDFLKNRSTFNNQTEVELEWPCEVRILWLKIQGLVSLVRFLFHDVMIIIVIFGMLLNTISFCVLNSSPMNTCSVSVYLRALAVADTGVLLYNGAAIIRSGSKRFNSFYLSYSWLCTTDRIVFVTSVYSSTWFVVALTMERLIMIIFPFHIRNWGTTRTATWSVAVITVLALSFAVLRSQVAGFEKENVYEYAPCGAKSRNWSGYLYLFLSVGSWIPTTLILASNLYLTVQVRRSANKRSHLSAHKGEGDAHTLRMTRMLLLVSASYLFTVLPLAIVSSTEMYWKAALGKQPAIEGDDRADYIRWKRQLLLLKWIRSLFFFFYMMNFGCNFFLYYISGQKFRRAVKEFLHHWLSYLPFKKCKSTNTTHSQSNRRDLSTSSSNRKSSEDQEVNRRISDSSTISDLVFYNSGFTNTETDLKVRRDLTTNSGNRNSFQAEEANRGISDSSTISEFVHHNSAFTNTETDSSVET